MNFLRQKLCRVGLVVRVFVSHTVVHGFASRPGHTKDHNKNGVLPKTIKKWGHTKDHQKNGTNCLPALHACVRVGV